MMRPTIPSRLRLSLLCFFLVGVAAVPPVPVLPAQADVWDIPREWGDRAEKKIIEIVKKYEHPCTECGKVVYVDTKCPLCRAKAAQRKLEAAQRQMEETQRKVKGAGLQAAVWVDRHKDILAAMAENARLRYGTLIWRAIHDPESRRRACEAIGIILEVCRQVKAQDEEGVYRALNSALDLPIQTDSGEKTLGELAKARLIARFPYLEGTDIAKDPAAPLAALLTIDLKYFWSECKLIKRGHEYVSIEEAIRRSNSFNIDEAVASLDLMEATEGLACSADAGKGSARALAYFIHFVKPSNR